MSKEKNNSYKVMQPFLLSLMVVIGMIAGYKLNDIQEDNLIRFFPGEQEITIGRVEEVLRYLDNKYLYEPNAEVLTEDALQQVFSRLDPYSLYIPASDLQEVTNNMNGHYKGIGIETLILEDTLLITDILKNSPAQRAGLEKMDRIIKLSGASFVNENLDFPEFRKHFQTQKDSSILTVLRKRTGEELDFKLLSEKVQTNSINHHFKVDDSTLYVRIDQFISNTYREFMKILEEQANQEKIPALILDLRDNPGGYLGEVTKILSQFFDESDQLLVRTKIRDGQERKYESTGRTFYDIGKIVILINENSASGSEVLAGAIQDWDRGLVIGKQSFGKGLVQEQYELSNGGAVRLTVANYFLPSGRSIQQAFDIDSSYFHIDSIWSLNKKEYKSLKYRRPLNGNVGIVPDIQIKEDLYEKAFYPAFYANDLIENEIIQYLESHPALFEMDQGDFVENFQLDLSDIQLETLLEEHPSLDQDLLQTLLKAKMAGYLFNKEVKLKILLEKDPVMVKAMEKMSENDWFGFPSS